MTAFVAMAIGLGLCAWALLCWPAWRRAPAGAAAPDRPSRRLLAGLAIVLAGVALGGYAWVGSPDKVGTRPGVPTTPTEQIEALLGQLEKQVRRQPADAQAWAELARGNVAVGRTPEALVAFRQALVLRPDDADLLTDFADVLAVRNDRELAGEPTRLLERALRADPKHIKALTLSGMAAFKRQDHATAVQRWDQVAGLLPPGDPLMVQLAGVMAQARQLASERGMAARGVAASNPTR